MKRKGRTWRLAKSIIEYVILAGSSVSRVFGALAGPLGLTARHRQHCHFDKDWRFGASKPEKISGPQAHVTGARLNNVISHFSQIKLFLVHLLGARLCKHPPKVEISPLPARRPLGGVCTRRV